MKRPDHFQARPGIGGHEAVDETRRWVLKTGGAAAVAALAAPHVARTQVLAPTRPPSPPTSPWAEELPVQRPLSPVSGLSPEPTATAGARECGRAAHQAWATSAPRRLYQLEVKVGSHRFHPELPTQEVWGYEGQYPGPLFHARYGEPILVRLYNKLPPTLQGYGSPDVSMHLHNMHTPSESDGFPLDWFSPTGCGPTLTRAGEYKDHHYPMAHAGGDPREALGTLWYHDHRVDFTAPNVYRGMAGFFLAFDAVDSGNEHDRTVGALRLPSGEFDVPLLVTDKHFDSGGYALFDQLNTDGFIGDKQLVNGKIQPYFHVAPRRYRLRILNGCTARTIDLQLRYQNSPQLFQFIASDGNLLEAPLLRSSVHLGGAERGDIVVDFSRVPPGSELFLVNRLQQLLGTKPESAFLSNPVQLLKFVVDRPLSEPDASRVPARLREQPPIDLAKVAATRTFSFNRSGGQWTVNDKPFDGRPVATPKMGTAEIWTLRNESGGWAHPVHIHFEEGRILKRNGREPPGHERGRKDIYFLGPNENVEVFLQFRNFQGKYVMHCHNLIHEDHAMMVRYDIVP